MIMMDKPIIAIAHSGVAIPKKLRLVADRVLEADIDTEPGRQALPEAIAKTMKELTE
jgi:hypothetical protein